MSTSDPGQLTAILHIPNSLFEICVLERHPKHLSVKKDPHSQGISIKIQRPLFSEFSVGISLPIGEGIQLTVLKRTTYSLTTDTRYLDMKKDGGTYHLKPKGCLKDTLDNFVKEQELSMESHSRSSSSSQHIMTDIEIENSHNERQQESNPYFLHFDPLVFQREVDEKIERALRDYVHKGTLEEEIKRVQKVHQDKLTQRDREMKQRLDNFESRHGRLNRELESRLNASIAQSEERLSRRIKNLEDTVNRAQGEILSLKNSISRSVQTQQSALLVLATNLDKMLNSIDERIKRINPLEQLGSAIAYMEENPSDDTKVVVSTMITSFRHLQFVRIDNHTNDRLAGKKLPFAILISPAYSDRIGESVNMINVEKCREISDNVIIMVQLSAMNDNSFNINTESAAHHFGVSRVLLMYSFMGEVVKIRTNDLTMQHLNRILPKPPRVEDKVSLQYMVESALRQ